MIAREHEAQHAARIPHEGYFIPKAARHSGRPRVQRALRIAQPQSLGLATRYHATTRRSGELPFRTVTAIVGVDLANSSFGAILDEIFIKLPSPPFTPADKKLVANNVYAHIWQQAMSGEFPTTQ